MAVESVRESQSEIDKAGQGGPKKWTEMYIQRVKFTWSCLLGYEVSQSESSAISLS